VAGEIAPRGKDPRLGHREEAGDVSETGKWSVALAHLNALPPERLRVVAENSRCPQAQGSGLTSIISVGANSAWRCPGCPGFAPGVPVVVEEEGFVTHGGSEEGGRSELREVWDSRASSAAIRAVCCWMTASSWMINWRITSSVWSQLAASGGSPAGTEREVATASPSWLARQCLQQRLGLLQIGGVKALGEPAIHVC
jgi:hypothetical protein